MKNLFFAISLCFAFAQIFTQPASALVYDVRVCTPGIDCNIGSHGTSPGSSGPSNADFQQFFTDHLGVDLSGATFTWDTKTNANGYWFGTVQYLAYMIDTQYVWNGSQLICCVIDQPYTITDGNDNNLFIGEDIYGMSNNGQPLWPAFLAAAGGDFALPPVSYSLTPHAWSVIGGDWFSVDFLAIDNDNRILASGAGPTGWLIFDPTAVPEPSSALLLAPLIAGVFASRRARRPSSRPSGFRSVPR